MRATSGIQLKFTYVQRDLVKIYPFLFPALTFVPVDRVAEGLALIRKKYEHDEIIRGMCDYFSRNYVSG